MGGLNRKIKTGVERAAGARRRLSGAGRAVALTFDDGPDPVYTPAILDILDDLAVPATFFVIGHKAGQHPDIVRRMMAQGCAVGSHSATHPDPAQLTIRELAGEYRQGAASLDEIVGGRVRRFRPPMGRIGRRGVVAIRSCGLRPWLWSLDPVDWRPTTTVESILRTAALATPGDIVLLHDGIESPTSRDSLDRSNTVDAIRPLVASLRAAGLTFAVLP